MQLPHVNKPHKVRVTMTKDGPRVLVAGQSMASLLVPNGKFPNFLQSALHIGDGNHLRFLDDGRPLVARRFGGLYAFDKTEASGRKFVPEIDGPYVDFRTAGKDLLTAYGQLYRRDNDGKFPKAPTRKLPLAKDWTFLGVGDFNGDGKPDAAFLSYGMDKTTSARIFYGRSESQLSFGDKHDAVIPLSALLSSAQKKNQTFSLVRDTPVVADWNGDGIDDLVVAHGQSDEVLVLLGGKDGLSKERVQRIALEYRVHYEHGVYVGDFNGDGKADLAVFGYTNTGVGASGPPAVYIWLQ
jgi:hypothetical protein